MTNEQLCSQFEIMPDAELQMLAWSQSVSDIKDLHKKMDNKQQVHLKRMGEFFDSSMGIKVTEHKPLPEHRIAYWAVLCT